MSNSISPRFYFLLSIAFVLLIVLVLAGPSNPMESLPGQDNGVFLYAGQQILAGGVPYVDFWDHKGPLIFYINAFGLMLASGSRWGVWLIELIFLFLTAIGLYQIVHDKWGSIPGFFALWSWFFMMQKVGSYHHFGDSNYTESYGLLFTTWAVLFWQWSQTKRMPMLWCFFVGVMAGLNFLLRPNNVSIHIAILLLETIAFFLVVNKGLHFKRIGAVFLGWGSVVCSFLVLFWAIGAAFELVDAVFVYNTIYSGRNATFENVLLVIKSGLSHFYWIPLIAFLGVTGKTFHSLVIRGGNFLVENQFGLFLAIGFLIEVILSALSGRILLHYYISWTPVVVLLTFCFIFIFFGGQEKLMVRIGRGTNIKAFLVVFVLLFGALHEPVLLKYIQVIKSISESRRLEPEKAMIEFIRNTTVPGDTVLVWGNDVWINFLAQRVSPTKYAYQYPLFMPGYTNRAMVDSFLRELTNCPPVYVIEPLVDTDEILPLDHGRRASVVGPLPLPDGMDNVFDFVDRHYVFVRSFNDVNIYKWDNREDANRNCTKR